MVYNKFIKQDGTILLDLTGDTTTESLVGKGVVFHKPDGTQSIGTCELGGGKEPILTELTVTENGTYENPVIEEELVIAKVTEDNKLELILNVGEYITFKKEPTICREYADSIIGNGGTAAPYAYVDPYGTYWRCDIMGAEVDNGEFAFCLSLSKTPSSGSTVQYNYYNEAMQNDASGWYVDDGNGEKKLDTPPSFPFGSFEGMTADWEWFIDYSNDFFQGTTTPADGWNKVTVNVAGDIVDVSELPIENIEEGKIYRVNEEVCEGAFLNLGNDECVSWTLPSEGLWGTESVYEYIYHLVDEVPVLADMIVTSPYDALGYTEDNPYPMHIYVVRSTGRMYNNENGSIVDSFDYVPLPLGGVVSDKSEIPVDERCYTVIKKNTTYGISDEANNKTVMEHNGSEWVEVGASEPCLHVPNMVPNDGSYVESIYYNVNATPDEVAEAVKRIPHDCFEQDGTVYFLYVTNTTSPAVIVKISTDEYEINCQDIYGSSANYMLKFKADLNKWVFANAYGRDHKLSVNSDTNTTFEGMSVGKANHLLTDIFSIRPFTAT